MEVKQATMLDVSALPVQYYSQPKAWMTGEILDAVLNKFNRKLSIQNRNVVLPHDNAGCHLHDLIGKYSNIELIFYLQTPYPGFNFWI